ncbi:MAG: hypothetical protein D6741_12120, partial [Planctomycetota bacterium]
MPAVGDFGGAVKQGLQGNAVAVPVVWFAVSAKWEEFSDMIDRERLRRMALELTQGNIDVESFVEALAK